MEDFCQCKEKERDTDDKGRDFCLNCLKLIEMPEPDLDLEVEEEIKNLDF